MKILFIVFMFIKYLEADEENIVSSNLQCYKNFRTKDGSNQYIVNFLNPVTVDTCTKECFNRYYRFIALRHDICYCMNNYEGEEKFIADCNYKCKGNPSQICGGYDESIFAIYPTDLKVPDAPQNVQIQNVTEKTISLKWQPPEYKQHVMGYVLTAHALHTYSSSVLNALEWKIYNNTLSYTMFNLHPATTYNITLQALSADGLGRPASIVATTVIGIPDPAPITPQIVKVDDKQLTVSIEEMKNENGPITAYRIVVINDATNQGFTPEYLKSYSEAIKDGLPYYITAELRPSELRKNFTIGDGRYYNGFYNAPISDTSNVDVAIGIVSTNGSISKMRYTQPSGNKEGIIILNVGNGYEMESNLNLALIIAITFLGILLVLSIFSLYYLKYRIKQQRRRTDCQELTLQGPILEMENSGYIPEEEIERVNHYDNLRDKVWNIPKNFLDIKSDQILGQGKFGRVISGTVQRDMSSVPVAIAMISDHNLQKNDAKRMLNQLNILIVAGNHENVNSLIGFYENPTTLYIAMEHYENVFKDWLLECRQYTDDGTKFTALTQNELIAFFIQIASGMQHLGRQKLVHGQLCCRNILLDTVKMNCKITGFGLSDYVRNGKHLDYSRWHAHELFRQRQPSTKSDVWSFGCLMWEACALGGTPFVNIQSKDVGNEIRRGARLHQLSYITTDIYQVMLNCWQMDSDERPTFEEVIQNLEFLLHDCIQLMDFSVNPGFSYEKYLLELETSK